MNGFVVFGLILIFVIVIARIINKLFPPDYHQRVEEKYNENNE